VAILTTQRATSLSDLNTKTWHIVAKRTREQMYDWTWFGGIKSRDVREVLCVTGISEDGLEYWLYAKLWKDGRRPVRFQRVRRVEPMFDLEGAV
jgi:hypothetical protein